MRWLVEGTNVVHLRLRGKMEKVWGAKWREDVLLADGSAHRVRKGELLGTVKEYKTRRLADDLQMWMWAANNDCGLALTYKQ